MSDFDPYHKWLGIPPQEQPAHYYRLLGITDFEVDREVISSAAEQRTVYLRMLQAGEHELLVAELLNEVSQARVTLLNADQKAEYDEELREQQTPEPKAVAMPPPIPVVQTPAPTPVVVRGTVTQDFPVSVVQPAKRPRRRKPKEIWKRPAVIGVSVVCVIGVLALLMSFMFSGDAEPVPAQATANTLPPSLREGLVAYYPFNGDTKDESGNGHDGSFINGGNFTEDRNRNKLSAFSLENHKQSIQFDGLGPYAPTAIQGVSISFWATRNVMANVMGQNTVFAIQLETEDDNGYDWNIFGDGHGTFRGAPKHYSNDLWQHWFVQIFPEDKGVKVFVNGKLEVGGYNERFGNRVYVEDKPGHFALNSNTQLTSVYPVQTYGTSRNDGRGSIDDIRIYNRALSEAEVKALYDYESKPPVADNQNNSSVQGPSPGKEVSSATVAPIKDAPAKEEREPPPGFTGLAKKLVEGSPWKVNFVGTTSYTGMVFLADGSFSTLDAKLQQVRGNGMLTGTWKAESDKKVSVSYGGEAEFLTIADEGSRIYARYFNDGSIRNEGIVVESRPVPMPQQPGTLAWKFATGGEIESSAAIGADGTIYFGSGDTKLYALDGKTGVKKWEFKTGDKVVSSPAVGSDGTVYFGSNDDKVRALDGKSGEFKWEFKTGGDVTASPSIGIDGTIYVGSHDQKIYALDHKNGNQKWAFDTPREVRSSIAIGIDGTVFVGSFSSRLLALDGRTGILKWDCATRGGTHGSPAIGNDGSLYFGTWGGRVYGLDGETGSKKWERTTGRINLASPVIGNDGTVYFGSWDKTIYALDGRTGKSKWEFNAQGTIDTAPTIGTDGTVYIGSGDKTLYALDEITGKKKWEFVGTAAFSSSPVLSNEGLLFVGSRDRHLYVIKTASRGLADSPWPMRGQNPQHTGRAIVTSASPASASPASTGPLKPLPKGPPLGPAPPVAVAPFDHAQAQAHQQVWAKYLGVPQAFTLKTEFEQPLRVEFVLIPPGRFLMGTSPEAKTLPQEGPEILSLSRPQHPVVITRPFYISKYEITQIDFHSVMGGGKTVVMGDGRKLPATQINWGWCSQFCDKVTQKGVAELPGAQLRLPTEAEWEYACRAGTTTRFWFGDTVTASQAMLRLRGFEFRLMPIDSFTPNPFGLFHVHGNNHEWCHDWHSDDYYAISPLEDPVGPAQGESRILRGGGFSNPPFGATSSWRQSYKPDTRSSSIGFRPLLVLPEEMLPKELRAQELPLPLQKLAAKIERDLVGHVIKVDLTGTQVSDADLHSLKGLNALRELLLTRTAISDSGLQHLVGLTRLEKLVLTQTGVTDAGLEHLHGLKSLKELWFVDQKQITDAGLEHLKGLTRLESLFLSGTQVTGSGLVYLKGLSRLEMLFLDGTPTVISKVHMEPLKELENLKHLSLYRLGPQRVTDDDLKHLAQLGAVRHLNLNFNPAITDAGLVHLMGMSELTYLDLRNTAASEAGVSRLRQSLPDCRILRE
jgi:outer membrane protein assembly factor BamB/formylglycine-generating enzyme required for sulfatase activity